MKKKIILFSLIASLIIGMTACNNENSVQEITEQITSISETVTEKKTKTKSQSETSTEKTETAETIDQSETSLTVNNETQITVKAEKVTESAITETKEENKNESYISENIFNNLSITIDESKCNFPLSLDDLGAKFELSKDYVSTTSKNGVKKIAQELLYNNNVIGVIGYYGVDKDDIQRSTKANSIMLNHFDNINSFLINDSTLIENNKMIASIEDVYRKIGNPTEEYSEGSFCYEDTNDNRLIFFFEENTLSHVSIIYNGGN